MTSQESDSQWGCGTVKIAAPISNDDDMVGLFKEAHDSRSSTLEHEPGDKDINTPYDSESYSPHSCEFDMKSVSGGARSPSHVSPCRSPSPEIEKQCDREPSSAAPIPWEISDDEAEGEEIAAQKRLEHHLRKISRMTADEVVKPTQSSGSRRLALETVRENRRVRAESRRIRAEEIRIRRIQKSILGMGNNGGSDGSDRMRSKDRFAGIVRDPEPPLAQSFQSSPDAMEAMVQLPEIHSDSKDDSAAEEYPGEVVTGNLWQRKEREHQPHLEDIEKDIDDTVVASVVNLVIPEIKTVKVKENPVELMPTSTSWGDDENILVATQPDSPVEFSAQSNIGPCRAYRTVPNHNYRQELHILEQANYKRQEVSSKGKDALNRAPNPPNSEYDQASPVSSEDDYPYGPMSIPSTPQSPIPGCSTLDMRGKSNENKAPQHFQLSKSITSELHQTKQTAQKLKNVSLEMLEKDGFQIPLDQLPSPKPASRYQPILDPKVVAQNNFSKQLAEQTCQRMMMARKYFNCEDIPLPPLPPFHSNDNTALQLPPLIGTNASTLNYTPGMPPQSVNWPTLSEVQQNIPGVPTTKSVPEKYHSNLLGQEQEGKKKLVTARSEHANASRKVSDNSEKRSNLVSAASPDITTVQGSNSSISQSVHHPDLGGIHSDDILIQPFRGPNAQESKMVDICGVSNQYNPQFNLATAQNPHLPPSPTRSNITGGIDHSLQKYQMNKMLLEQQYQMKKMILEHQNKGGLMRAGQMQDEIANKSNEDGVLSVNPTDSGGNHILQDRQLQLMLLEQQNMQRVVRAKQILNEASYKSHEEGLSSVNPISSDGRNTRQGTSWSTIPRHGLVQILPKPLVSTSFSEVDIIPSTSTCPTIQSPSVQLFKPGSQPSAGPEDITLPTMLQRARNMAQEQAHRSGNIPAAPQPSIDTTTPNKITNYRHTQAHSSIATNPPSMNMDKWCKPGAFPPRANHQHSLPRPSLAPLRTTLHSLPLGSLPGTQDSNFNAAGTQGSSEAGSGYTTDDHALTRRLHAGRQILAQQELTKRQEQREKQNPEPDEFAHKSPNASNMTKLVSPAVSPPSPASPSHTTPSRTRHGVVVQNFPPRTTREAIIESVEHICGEKDVLCTPATQNGNVNVQILFQSRKAADEVVNCFDNKPFDGCVLRAFHCGLRVLPPPSPVHFEYAPLPLDSQGNPPGGPWISGLGSHGPHRGIHALQSPPPPADMPNGIWVRTITSPEGETTTTMQMHHPFLDFKNAIEVTTTTSRTATEVTTTTVTSFLPIIRSMDNTDERNDGEESERGKENEKDIAGGAELGNLEGQDDDLYD